jgi:hypothetical protein
VASQQSTYPLTAIRALPLSETPPHKTQLTENICATAPGPPQRGRSIRDPGTEVESRVFLVGSVPGFLCHERTLSCVTVGGFGHRNIGGGGVRNGEVETSVSPAEFRQQMVELYHAGQSTTELAQDFVVDSSGRLQTCFSQLKGSGTIEAELSGDRLGRSARSGDPFPVLLLLGVPPLTSSLARCVRYRSCSTKPQKSGSANTNIQAYDARLRPARRLGEFLNSLSRRDQFAPSTAAYRSAIYDANRGRFVVDLEIEALHDQSRGERTPRDLRGLALSKRSTLQPRRWRS